MPYIRHAPILHVISNGGATVTTSPLVLHFSHVMARIGFGRVFNATIPIELIPVGSTAAVMFTDPTGVMVPARTRLGNILRADSLLRRLVEGREHPLMYINDDDLHITLLDEVPRSRFEVLPVPVV